MRTAAAIGSSRHLTKSGIASAALFFTAYSTALPSTSLTTSSPVILLLQIATTSSASRWLSMRSSQVRLWRSATHHLLHHRAEGDLEKLDSSPKTKKPIAPATLTPASAFRRHHLSDAPVRERSECHFTPMPPAADTPQPPCLACSSSATLTGTQIGPHSPILVGKIRADRRRMNFPILPAPQPLHP